MTQAVRALSRACVAAVMAVLAAGCTSAPPDLVDPANRAEGSGTIVWVSSPTLRNASDDARQVLVDAFEQAYPSIKVDLKPGPDSTNRLHDELVGELSAGSATPDVYSGDVIWPAEFAHDGLALPLDDYLPASFWDRFATPSDGSASDSALIRAMSYQGHVYAVPYFIDEGFLFYRKDLLARAGLAPPATWEDLVQDSQTLKRLGLPYEFVWQGDDYEGLTCVWTEVLADAVGGESDTGPIDAALAARLASPQALKALTFLQGLIGDGVSPAEVRSDEEPQSDTAFDTGQAAFLRSWDSSYANAMSATSKVADPADVGVIAPPTFAGQRGVGYSVIGGWNLFVNPHSRDLRADLTFVQWMAGEQAQRILATQFSEIPADYAVRSSPTVSTGNPILTAAALTRQISRPSSTTDYGRLSSVIFSAIHQALPAAPGAAVPKPCEALLAAARAIDPAVHSTLPCTQAGGA